MKISAITLSICLSLVCCVSFLQGQSEMPEMPKPQSEHQWLQQFVGKWTTEMEAKMGPDQPSMNCKGTMDWRSLGGFWVVNEMKADMMGQPMTGIQTIGYDPEKKKYVGSWVDSMTSYQWRYEGTVDASGKKIVLEADGPNFMAEGQTTKFRDAYEFKSKDEIIATSTMLGEDGKWVEYMTGTVTRKK